MFCLKCTLCCTYLILSCKDAPCHVRFHPSVLYGFKSRGNFLLRVCISQCGAYDRAHCHSIQLPNAKGSSVLTCSFCPSSQIVASAVTVRSITPGWRQCRGLVEGCQGAGMSQAQTDCSWVFFGHSYRVYDSFFLLFNLLWNIYFLNNEIHLIGWNSTMLNVAGVDTFYTSVSWFLRNSYQAGPHISKNTTLHTWRNSTVSSNRNKLWNLQPDPIPH